MKLNDLKVKYEEVEIAGYTFKLALNMNVLADLEDMYGNINKALASFKEKPIHELRNWIYVMLKGQIEDLTIEAAGEIISNEDITNLSVKIQNLINNAFPNAENSKEEENKKEKNV